MAGSNWGGSHPDDQDRRNEEMIRKMREQYMREADSRRNKERAEEAKNIIKRAKQRAKVEKRKAEKARREAEKKARREARKKK